MKTSDDHLAERLFLIQMERLADPTTEAVEKAAAASLKIAAIFRRQAAPPTEASGPEPRRTVGAVVRWASDEWIVVLPGEGDNVLHRLSHPAGDPCPSCNGDEFVRWATREECERHGIPYVARPLPGAPRAAPSPAASTAPYVPAVGDVVKQMSETDKTATSGAIRVVVSTDPLRWVYVENGAKVGGACEPRGWADEVRFVRRATSDERAAAGLPVDESATKPVDRVALAKVLYESWGNNVAFYSPFNESNDFYSKWLRAADAAIAFMAKAPAFDEAKEREAAEGSWANDIRRMGNRFDAYVEGWLARARVAAKGCVA